MRRVWIIGSITLFTAILLGAFGAHALKGHLDAESTRWWGLANDYHRAHGLGLLALALAWPYAQHPHRLMISMWCLLIGVLFFSGSLYLLALTKIRWLGAVTPIGGSLWLIGWAISATAGLSMRRSIKREGEKGEGEGEKGEGEKGEL